MIGKIFKYPLSFAEYQTLSLPDDSKLLVVEMQGNQLTVWIFVGNGEMINFQFFLYATGKDVQLQNTSHYLGTVFPSTYVFHIFGNIEKA